MNIRTFLARPGNRRFIYYALSLGVSFMIAISIINHLQRPDPEAVLAYRGQLNHPRAEKRIEAILALSRVDAAPAAPEIEIILLGDTDETVRRAAAYAILEIDRNRFFTLLEGADEVSRMIALETLARRERARATRYLVAGLDDESPAYRLLCLELMARFGDRRAEPILRETAADGEEAPAKRLVAIRAIGQRGGAESLSVLDEIARNDPDQELRTAAEEARQAARRMGPD